ncbi:MAG: ankyrin repeat domain-containing protein [Pseudomonadota bacterium]|nr:ankyrin repeat domain-containing protein [Pseudomonadota bacterium]
MVKKAFSPPLASRRALALALLAALVQPACGQSSSPRMNPEAFASPKEAALFEAAVRGDMAAARQQLAQGASLTAINAKESNVLDVAMLAGNWTAFITLLDLGADPAYRGSYRTTSMHLAAMLEDSRWLKEFLQRGASTEVQDSMGQTPLFPALGRNTQANFDLLLKAGANIHARDSEGSTLLHEAAAINSLEQVVTLLEMGIDPRLTDQRGKTFQSGVFMTPEDMLGIEARAARAKIRAWLQARGIPVEEPQR